MGLCIGQACRFRQAGKALLFRQLLSLDLGNRGSGAALCLRRSGGVCSALGLDMLFVARGNVERDGLVIKPRFGRSACRFGRRCHRQRRCLARGDPLTGRCLERRAHFCCVALFVAIAAARIGQRIVRRHEGQAGKAEHGKARKGEL